MAVFEGAGVALVTPMKANGEVNYDKLEEILEEQIAKGTDAIVACGTTGEASTLTHEEHLDVIRYTCLLWQEPVQTAPRQPFIFPGKLRKPGLTGCWWFRPIIIKRRRMV